jgi:asparagine synthase (glutamine-hydrolysing)
MSGIFGLVDPSGADAGALVSAAGRASFRGRPLVEAAGPVALGTYVREGQRPDVARDAAGLTVADGRVDAVSGLPNSEPASALLATILSTGGPEGLAEVAGDFAVARWDEQRRHLVLSRDAFGLRPLVWARRGRRLGFASDPEVLFALGLASGELDRAAVAGYLALRDIAGERTAFEKVRRILGGRWLRVDLEGRRSEGRWFRPEDVAPAPRPAEEAAEALADALTTAATSRVRRRRVALSLSGGRDSGAVAVALAQGDVRSTCVTQTFDPELGCSEEEPARRLAEAMGHRWLPAPVPVRITDVHLSELPGVSGTPLGFPAFPQALSLRDAAVSAGAEVVLDGQGGEPLFSASPLAVLDLLRRGRVKAAAAAARGFRQRWIYPYPVVAKVMLRALLPRPLLAVRERMRVAPPWVDGAIPAKANPTGRTARANLVSALIDAGRWPVAELWERLFARAGVEYSSPLLDARVVRLALSLPVELRVPVPTPKPLLARALLDGFDASRRKARFTQYYMRLAASARNDFPGLLGPRALSAVRGYIRRDRLEALSDPRWVEAALPLLNVETWLLAAERGR